MLAPKIARSAGQTKATAEPASRATADGRAALRLTEPGFRLQRATGTRTRGRKKYTRRTGPRTSARFPYSRLTARAGLGSVRRR